MNLNLESLGGFPTSPPLYAEAGRALLSEDLVVLETTPANSAPATIKKIREIHHQAARLMATGMKDVEISAVIGLTQNRLSILKNDPAFKELIQFYSGREDARFEVVQDRLKAVGLDALAEIHERITEGPEAIGTKTLLEIATSALGASGHGPILKHQHSHVVLTAEELSKLKHASRSPIDVTPAQDQGNSGAGGGEANPAPALEQEQETSEGFQRTGTGV